MPQNGEENKRKKEPKKDNKTAQFKILTNIKIKHEAVHLLSDVWLFLYSFLLLVCYSVM